MELHFVMKYYDDTQLCFKLIRFDLLNKPNWFGLLINKSLFFMKFSKTFISFWNFEKEKKNSNQICTQRICFFLPVSYWNRNSKSVSGWRMRCLPSGNIFNKSFLSHECCAVVFAKKSKLYENVLNEFLPWNKRKTVCILLFIISFSVCEMVWNAHVFMFIQWLHFLIYIQAAFNCDQLNFIFRLQMI